MEELAQVMSHVEPHPILHLGPIPISNTVVNTWIMMLVLIFIAFITSRGLKLVPRGWQHLPEIAVEFVLAQMEPALGKKAARKYLPLVATLFIFILFLNLSWFIPGMKPATMDLSTTLGFAVATIFIVQLIGLREQGVVGYIKHFFSPNAGMAPLNIIEEVVKPISLSLRLFGNIFGGKMVVTIITMMIPLLVPGIIYMLETLVGFIQAFVFALLTITYIGAMVHGH